MATPAEISMVKLFFKNTTYIDSWTDDEIASLIDSGMSPIDCAIFIVDTTLSSYTTKPNIKVGQIQLDWKAVIDGLNSLKLDLIYRKNNNAGNPGGSGSSSQRRIGGAFFTGGCIPRKFEDGQFDNPPFTGD